MLLDFAPRFYCWMSRLREWIRVRGTSSGTSWRTEKQITWPFSAPISWTRRISSPVSPASTPWAPSCPRYRAKSGTSPTKECTLIWAVELGFGANWQSSDSKGLLDFFFFLDRKAVISQGMLKCLGSSLFLKSKWGIGYRLRYSFYDTLCPYLLFSVDISKITPPAPRKDPFINFALNVHALLAVLMWVWREKQAWNPQFLVTCS